LLSESLPDSTVNAFSYAPREVGATTTIATEGLVSRRTWHRDAYGRLAAVDEYADPEGSEATTTYAYDAFDQLAQVVDAMANDAALCGTNPACPGQRHTTKILYDELGNRIQLDDPDSGTWSTPHDARGLPTGETDPRGKQQVYTYDPVGRLTKRHAANPPTAWVA
jgi:YD repeat-containing protein